MYAAVAPFSPAAPIDCCIRVQSNSLPGCVLCSRLPRSARVRQREIFACIHFVYVVLVHLAASSRGKTGALIQWSCGPRGISLVSSPSEELFSMQVMCQERRERVDSSKIAAVFEIYVVCTHLIENDAQLLPGNGPDPPLPLHFQNDRLQDLQCPLECPHTMPQRLGFR